MRAQPCISSDLTEAEIIIQLFKLMIYMVQVILQKRSVQIKVLMLQFDFSNPLDAFGIEESVVWSVRLWADKPAGAHLPPP